MLPQALWKKSTYELAWRQQFFAWGQDVVSDHGNLLQKFGFQKLPRQPNAGFSEYIWNGVEDIGTQITPDLKPHHIHLWAHGICSKIENHSLFYSRSSLQPWLIENPPSQLPNSHEDWMSFLAIQQCPRQVEQSNSLLVKKLQLSLFSWVAFYEAWVRSTVGTSYRDATTCVRKDSIVPGSKLEELWQSYARSNFCHY